MPSFESLILKVFLAVIIVCGVIIVLLLAPRFLPNPATITPKATTIDAGQTVSIGVGWKGGSAPYTITLYSSSSGDCTLSSTVVGKPKSDQSNPQFIFTVSPVSTTRYCGAVSSSTKSSTISSSVLITVGPALHAPTLTLSSSAMDSGQSATVTATATVTGGSAPYEFTLYSGTGKTCSADTTVVSVSSGSNPITGLTSTTAHFSFAAPTANTFYCVTVTNSGSSSLPKVSSPVQFDVNPALTVSVSAAASELDSGQSTSLSALVSHGTPSYSYQWYSGLTCATPIKGQNKPSFSTGALTSTSSFSVRVNDSSTGAPAAVSCAKVTVTVSSAFTKTKVTIGPSVILDSGELANLTVSWHGAGILPYTVNLTTSFSSDCSSPMDAGLNMTGLTNTSVVFTTLPFATTYYCATVTDSAGSPESASTTSAATVTVNPTLAPVVALFPSAIDAGQTATLTADVDLTSGTSPYTVTLYSSPIVNCTYDTTEVWRLSGPTATFSITAPSSSMYYCATVRDSATASATVMSPSAEFLVNPILSATISAASPSVVTGHFDSLTANPLGGTFPYFYQWYNGTTCTAPNKMAGQTSQVYSTGALKSTSKYSVIVTDNSHGTPAESSGCVTTTVTVTPALVSALALSPQAMDKGPSTIVTANVTMSGGTPPYTVTLYSGSTPSCASDTTKVVVSSGSNPQTGVTGTSTTFNFASQASSTYYCATVKDSAPTPATVLTSTVLFAVNPSLDTPILTISPTVLDAGQSAIVTAKVTWSGGTSPYTVTLHSGSSPNCAFDTTIVASSFKNATSASFTLASPASNTYYCATVKDSGVTPLTVSSATSLFTVNPPVSISAFFLSPLALDSGQPTTVTASVSWSGGISSYAVTLYSSPSANCGSGGTVVAVLTGFNPMTGVTKTTETFTFAPPVTTTYYCAVVTDSSSMPMTVTSAPATVVYGPEGVALNPRTGFVYVTDPLSYRISVIDSFSNTVVNTIAVGSLPWGIAVNPITNVVYVTNYGSGTVTVINGTTNKVITTITVRTGPEGIAINLALNLVYVADSGSDFVSVINATTNTVIASAPVGNNPTSVAIGPSPIYSVFVTDYGSNTVSVIQPHVDGSYGVTPVAVGGSPWGVAVDNSTNRVYVTNSGSGTVSVLNGSTFATVTTITIGTGSTPEGIAINAAASMAYVANAGSNTVSVINTATNKVITSTSPPIPIPVESIPSSVALLPSTNYAFVTNFASNSVSVINLTANEIVATITVS